MAATSSVTTRTPSRARWLIPAAGYAVSLACLVWVYRGFDWGTEIPKLAAADWRWVLLAVVSDISVYVCQGFRWSLLLRPLGRIPALRSIQAIYIGLFANEVLPLRTGELIRCYLQGRWSALAFSVVLSSILLERLLDGVWLLAGFYAAGRFVALPRLLAEGSKILGALIVVVGALLAYAIVRKDGAQPRLGRWDGLRRRVVEALHAMGRSPSFYGAALLSLLYLGLQVVPVYALTRAVDLPLPLGAVAVVLLILRLGSVPPQAPSNVGTFQFFTILGLTLFGIPRPEATRFATLLFVVVTLPLWLAGFVALLATRMRLREIRRDAQMQIEQAPAVRG